MPIYCTLKLVGEFGECREALLEGYSKETCDQKLSSLQELGDMLWYITVMMNFYGMKLEDVLPSSIMMNLSHAVPRTGYLFDLNKHIGNCCHSVCCLSEYVGKCFVKGVLPDVTKMHVLLRAILLEWSKLAYFSISDFEYIMRANEQKLRARMQNDTILVIEKRIEAPSVGNEDLSFEAAVKYHDQAILLKEEHGEDCAADRFVKPGHCNCHLASDSQQKNKT